MADKQRRNCHTCGHDAVVNATPMCEHPAPSPELDAWVLEWSPFNAPPKKTPPCPGWVPLPTAGMAHPGACNKTGLEKEDRDDG